MQKNDIVRANVEEINNLGFGVAHTEGTEKTRGKVVFVRDGVTGDVLDARIIKVNKRAAEQLRKSPSDTALTTSHKSRQ